MTNLNKTDNDCGTAVSQSQESLFSSYLETDLMRWNDYFMLALEGFARSPEVATWNEERLVTKAASLADVALKAFKAAKKEL